MFTRTDEKYRQVLFLNVVDNKIYLIMCKKNVYLFLLYYHVKKYNFKNTTIRTFIVK